MFSESPGREERTPRINPVAGPTGGHPLSTTGRRLGVRTVAPGKHTGKADQKLW
jgi:hypothetical protein